MEYDFVLADASEKEEILDLYRGQIGSDFCVWDEDYPTMREIEYDLLRDALFVMKNEEGKIIATISLDLDEQVEMLECWSKNLAPGGELSRLCVRADYKCKGIAREMLLNGMKQLKERGFKSVHFLVAKDNLAAIKSYSKFDFNNVGEAQMFESDYWCYEKDLGEIDV